MKHTGRKNPNATSIPISTELDKVFILRPVSSFREMIGSSIKAIVSVPTPFMSPSA